MKEKGDLFGISKNKREPLISVIIPTYNMKKYITDAIDSVLAQTYKNVEIIVVDDGSTDFTKDIFKNYDSKIKYFYQENKGPSVARNLGIRRAKGEYIAFLDADDYWLANKLELQLNFFMNKYFKGLVYSDYYTVDDTGKILGMHNCRHFSKRRVLNTLYIKNLISTPTIMVNKECFEKIGLFDERLGVAEDWDMWLRICRNYDFEYINEPLVKIRVRRGSQSYYGDKNLENEIRFLDKLYSSPQLKNKILLKRKSYGYRYYSAAIAYKKSKDPRNVGRHALKAFLLYPLILFSKTYLMLILYAVLGERSFDNLRLQFSKKGRR